MATELFLCDCDSSEHQMIIRYFEDEFPDVFVDIHLVQKPLWYRIKYALRYIFGYKSQYGAWDEFIMNQEHIKPLEKVIEHIKKAEAVKYQMKLFNDRHDTSN